MDQSEIIGKMCSIISLIDSFVNRLRTSYIFRTNDTLKRLWIENSDLVIQIKVNQNILHHLSEMSVELW